MSTRKRIEITLTTRQTLVVRSSLRRAASWCPQCAGASQLFTPDEAAQVSEVSTRAIYRLIESGRLHFLETENGQVRVCLNSLLPDRF